MRLERVVGALITALASGLAIFAIILVLGIDTNNEANTFWRWVFLLAGWFPVVFLHELGHAIGAQAAGWRVLTFHVAPWAVRLRPFSLSFAGYVGGQDVAGFVAAIPNTRSANTKWRETAFTAGGPIASWLCFALLLAFVALASSTAPQTTPDNMVLSRGADLMVVRHTSDTPTHAFLLTLCVAFGFYSCACALVSTWPRLNDTRGANDGGLIVSLWREDRPTSLAYAYSLIQYGVPRRAWPPWISEELAQARTDTSAHSLAVHFILFLACMMERDDAGARETADALRAISADAAATRIAQGLVAAVVDNNPSEADDQLAKVKNLENAWPPVLRLRQIAIAAAMAREDGPGAINRIDAAASDRGAPDYPGGVWSLLSDRVVGLARRRGILG